MAKARILAVDDQRYFRELIAGMLANEGFEAQTATSAEEALQILETSDFDVVLTDLVMPGMDGSELVHRIHQRNPDQDVLVVTGVVDVKTAVDAMKLGATDYLLKPFNRHALATTLETILQNRRLKNEHSRLLEENIEYIGERSLYERALALFSTLTLDSLAMRLADALCLETRAQGAVVWLATQEGGQQLELSAARGLVRVADEQAAIDCDAMPAEFEREQRAALAPWCEGDSGQALYATLHRDGGIVGLVRLTDKLEGDAFDAVDVAAVDKFVRLADTAVANALRVRGLERHGLRDASTGAYNVDYFRNVARNEIEKANRFGRSFALLTLELGSAEQLEHIGRGEDLQSWMRGVTERLDGLLRSTDLLAVGEDRRFSMLLPEADALGAAIFKRRLLDALADADPLLALPAKMRPRAGLAIYPGDGVRLEELLAATDARIAEEAGSQVTALGLEGLSAVEGLQKLARLGEPETPAMAEQLTRFALSELARHPRQRGLLYAVPGLHAGDAVRDGLETLRGVPVRTDLVVIADGERPDFAAPVVSWIPPNLAPAGLPSCLIHYGGGPAYAWVRESDGAEPARLFHTNNRQLVEHLAFGLHDELALPGTLGGEATA
ncbi:MAG: response regulator [Deltaproteobacteria bacterium]|nr:response regulator [Deltaproteobacteria bacterium]MBW2360427.1 response regulator [Deltaproteobacteria bacterium]